MIKTHLLSLMMSISSKMDLLNRYVREGLSLKDFHASKSGMGVKNNFVYVFGLVIVLMMVSLIVAETVEVPVNLCTQDPKPAYCGLKEKFLGSGSSPADLKNAWDTMVGTEEVDVSGEVASLLKDSTITPEQKKNLVSSLRVMLNSENGLANDDKGNKERLSLLKGLQASEDEDMMTKVIGGPDSKVDFAFGEGSLDDVKSVEHVSKTDKTPAKLIFKGDADKKLVIPLDNLPGETLKEISLEKDSVKYKNENGGDLSVHDEAYAQHSDEKDENGKPLKRWEIMDVSNLPDGDKAFVKITDGNGHVVLGKDGPGSMQSVGGSYIRLENELNKKSSSTTIQSNGAEKDKLAVKLTDDQHLEIGSVLEKGGHITHRPSTKKEDLAMAQIDIAPYNVIKDGKEVPVIPKGSINLFGTIDPDDRKSLTIRGGKEDSIEISGNIKEMTGVLVKPEPQGVSVIGAIPGEGTTSGKGVTFGSGDDDFTVSINGFRITDGDVNQKTTIPGVQTNSGNLPLPGQSTAVTIPPQILAGTGSKIFSVNGWGYNKNWDVQALPNSGGGEDYYIKAKNKLDAQWAPVDINQLANGLKGGLRTPSPTGAMSTCLGGVCGVNTNQYATQTTCGPGGCTTTGSRRSCGPSGCGQWAQPFGDARDAAFPIVGGALRGAGNVAANVLATPFRIRRNMQERSGLRFPVIGRVARVGVGAVGVVRGALPWNWGCRRCR